MRTWASIVLAAAACAGRQDVAQVGDVSFRVEQPSMDDAGNDLDDAPPSVSLRVGSQEIDAGMMFGRCTHVETASPFVRESCEQGAPREAIASFACGDDPHVDEVACLYAVRARGAVELWRRNVTFTDSDDAPRTVQRHPLVHVGDQRAR